MFIIVISIFSSHLTQCRITLYTYKSFESIHPSGHRYGHLTVPLFSHCLGINLEHGFISILQFPYQHKTDKNRITYLIIYLDRFNIQITRPQGKLFLIHKRIHPVKTCSLESSFILTKENHNTSFIRLLRKISRQHQYKCQNKHKQYRNSQPNNFLQQIKVQKSQCRQHHQIK